MRSDLWNDTGDVLIWNVSAVLYCLCVLSTHLLYHYVTFCFLCRKYIWFDLEFRIDKNCKSNHPQDMLCNSLPQVPSRFGITKRILTLKWNITVFIHSVYQLCVAIWRYRTCFNSLLISVWGEIGTLNESHRLFSYLLLFVPKRILWLRLTLQWTTCDISVPHFKCSYRYFNPYDKFDLRFYSTSFNVLFPVSVPASIKTAILKFLYSKCKMCASLQSITKMLRLIINTCNFVDVYVS